jgi:hypothetical protein
MCRFASLQFPLGQLSRREWWRSKQVPDSTSNPQSYRTHIIDSSTEQYTSLQLFRTAYRLSADILKVHDLFLRINSRL